MHLLSQRGEAGRAKPKVLRGDAPLPGLFLGGFEGFRVLGFRVLGFRV